MCASAHLWEARDFSRVRLHISGKKSAPYFKIKDAWDGHGVLVNAVKIRTGEPCLVGYSEKVLIKSTSQIENPLSKGEKG
jgi:hypothetical protein